jgi:hypothetical protein
MVENKQKRLISRENSTKITCSITKKASKQKHTTAPVTATKTSKSTQKMYGSEQ